MSASSSLQLSRILQVSGVHAVNDLLTTGLVPALLPFFKQAHGLSYGQTGLILFCCLFTTSVTQPFFGWISDRRPAAWLLPTGMLITGAGLVASGFARSYLGVMAAIGVSGLGSAVFHPEAARCTYLAAGPKRATAQALFQSGGVFGQALGPLMVPLFLAATGLAGLRWFGPPTLVAVAVCGMLAPWYARGMRAERERAATRRADALHLPERPGALAVLLGVVVLRSFASVGVTAFLPFFYMNVLHFSVGAAMTFTFIYMLAGGIGTLAGGLLSDRIGTRRLMIWSLLASAPLLALLPHVRGALAVVVLIALGVIIFSPFSAAVVLAQRCLPRRIGLASGLNIGLAIGAGGLAAAFLGQVADRYGVPVVLEGLVVVPLAASALALALPRDLAAPIPTPAGRAAERKEAEINAPESAPGL